MEIFGDSIGDLCLDLFLQDPALFERLRVKKIIKHLQQRWWFFKGWLSENIWPMIQILSGRGGFVLLGSALWELEPQDVRGIVRIAGAGLTVGWALGVLDARGSADRRANGRWKR